MKHLMLSALFFVACGMPVAEELDAGPINTGGGSGGGTTATGGGTAIEEDAGADAGEVIDAGLLDAGPEEVDAGLPDAGPRDGGTDFTPTLNFTTPPITGLPPGTQFARAVPYGELPGQVMDVFLPGSNTPTAVLFYFHGGGFIQGSRNDAYSGSANVVRAMADAGIAFVGVDYRLLDEAGVETEGVLKSLKDSQRSLQFVRRWAQTFNVRTDRVGVFGTSAGAGTSLWLAFHPEMAVSTGTPVEQQSTRVSVAAVLSTQATYDLLRWGPDIFTPAYSYLTTSSMFSIPALQTMAERFYGLPLSAGMNATTLEAAMRTPTMNAYRAEVDMLALMSVDDPPVYVQNTSSNTSPVMQGFDLLHHPLHARTVLNIGTDAGVVVEADVPAFNIDSNTTATRYLIEHLRP